MQSAFAGAAVVTPVIAGPKIKVSMRDNGYTLGDIIAMHVEFRLAKGLEFDVNSVPLQGPVNNWLDLREVTMHQTKNSDDSSQVSIDFTWQVFGTVEHAQIVKIPAIQLQTLAQDSALKSAENKPLAITIPAQGFHLSPVLPPSLTENTHRPHAPPLRFDTKTPLTIALLSFSLALLCGALWLWLLDKISWWPRNPGPMTKLARQLRQQSLVQSFTNETLRTIHAGLAGCAGQSLYPNSLGNLFDNSPYLVPNKTEITQFFNASWRVFHEKNASSAASAICVASTLRWINQAAMAERLARRTVKKNAKKPAKTYDLVIKKPVKV
jgi:hypothetical protein